MKSKKVLIVGIDGGDWRYLNYGIEKNKLPTIKKLMQEGCYGKIKSTIPPTTFPAWLCFCSGKNPGKVGFYGYLRKLKDSYKTEIKIGDAFSKITPFWEELNKNGIKVGIVNIPSTYKPQKTNKFMVCLGDVDYAPKDKNRCFPKKLGHEINQKLGKLDYETNYAYFNKSAEEQLKENLHYLGNRSKLNKFLLDKYGEKLDLFLTVFFPDRLQHFVIDPEMLMGYYSELDKEIGRLIKLFKPEDVLLISDHGGGEVKKEFLINEFLIKEGFLKLKNERVKQKFLSRIGVNLENIQRIFAKLRIDSKIIKILPRTVIEDYFRFIVPAKTVSIEDVEIDWKRTIAYSITDCGGVYINLKGREPKGIVSRKNYEKVRGEIIDKLVRLKNPETEERIDSEIYRREEIYNGEYLEEAPDIVYSLDNFDYVPRIRLEGKVFKNPRDAGNHKQYGIMIASGKNIGKGEIKGGELIDIAPTILKLFNVKIPKEIDGKVLDIFKDKKV